MELGSINSVDVSGRSCVRSVSEGSEEILEEAEGSIAGLRESVELEPQYLQGGMQTNFALFDKNNKELYRGKTTSGLYIDRAKGGLYIFISNICRSSKFPDNVGEGLSKRQTNKQKEIKLLDVFVSVAKRLHNKNKTTTEVDKIATLREARKWYQLDSEQGAIRVLTESNLLSTDEPQTLFMAIGCTPCNKCSKEFKKLSDEFKNLRFAFKANYIYKENNRFANFFSQMISKDRIVNLEIYEDKITFTSNEPRKFLIEMNNNMNNMKEAAVDEKEKDKLDSRIKMLEEFINRVNETQQKSLIEDLDRKQRDFI